MLDQNDRKALALGVAPFIGEAIKNKRSMAVVEIDPLELFQHKGAPNQGGPKILIAMAVGSSIRLLQDALGLEQDPMGVRLEIGGYILEVHSGLMWLESEDGERMNVDPADFASLLANLFASKF